MNSHGTLTLDDFQQKALLAGDADVTVLASAGAGKTRVLTERFVRSVVESGLSPDQILTLTFTRKAAAEMKLRIVAELRRRGLTEAAQIAETGPIQTIHSFCERTLRENALEAGLDPQFRVLEGTEENILFDQAVTTTFHSELVLDQTVSDFLRAVAAKSYFESSPDIHDYIAHVVRTVVGTWRNSSLSHYDLERLYASPGTLSEALARQAFGADASEWILALQSIKPRPKFANGFVPNIEQSELHYSYALGRLALEVMAQYELRLHQERALDFSSLENRTLQLLSESSATRERLETQYRAMLVDETQDVNPKQFAIIDSLNIESTFWVGDDQQAIYTFRGADRTLFASRTDDSSPTMPTNYRSEPGIVHFVNQCFGALWPNGYRPMHHPSGSEIGDCSGIEVWETDGASGSVVNGIKQLITEGVSPNDIAVLARYSDTCDRIAALLRQSDIDYEIMGPTKRFHSSMEARDVANVLTACNDPYDDHALAATLLSPFVRLSFDSLVLLRTEEPLYDSLRSTTLEDADQQAKLERFLEWFGSLSETADRSPAWMVLSEILHRSDYMVNMAKRVKGERPIANVRKILTMAAALPTLDSRAFAERAKLIREVKEAEREASTTDPDDPVVKIMTLHASKGLEFPVVIVPDMDRGFDKQVRNQQVIIDKRTGLLASQVNKKSAAFRMLEVDALAEQSDEEMRILYVAMTRAERRLCLCTKEYKRESPILRALQAVGYPDELPAGVAVRNLAPTEPVDSPQ